MRYLSLFSGIGGFEVGIQRVWPEAVCVGYSEIDAKALKVYRDHFPHHPYLGPVEAVRGGDYTLDLLVGGSPCQDLSATNVKTRWGKTVPGGLQGPKSRLFYEFVRIYRESRPRYFILENVGTMKNEDRDIITRELGVEPVCINSRILVPQNRKRFYWTNVPLNEETRQLLTNGQSQRTVRDILVPVSEARHWVIDPEQSQLYQSYLKKIAKYGSALRMAAVRDTDEYSPSLLGGRTMYVQDSRLSRAVAGGEKRSSEENEDGRGTVVVRKMSPVEAERLQTFPDDWTRVLGYTDRMKVLGNAVTCNVIALLLESGRQ